MQSSTCQRSTDPGSLQVQFKPNRAPQSPLHPKSRSQRSCAISLLLLGMFEPVGKCSSWKLHKTKAPAEPRCTFKDLPRTISHVSCTVSLTCIGPGASGRPASSCYDSETAQHVRSLPCAQANTSDALPRTDFAGAATVLEAFDACVLVPWIATTYLAALTCRSPCMESWCLAAYYMPRERTRSRNKQSPTAHEAIDEHSGLLSEHLPQLQAPQFLDDLTSQELGQTGN